AGQGHFGDDLADLAGNDLLEDLGGLGLVLFGQLALRDFLFLVDDVGRHVGGVDVLRVHRGHVHGDALGQFVGTAFQGHQHADAAAVDVAADDAVAFHARDTAHVDLFADGGDQGLGGVFDRTVAAGVGGGLQRVDVGAVAVQGDLGDVV